ncbi:MAG: hypothetical protein ABFD79_17240 [Phycisphaerales bacterium]
MFMLIFIIISILTVLLYLLIYVIATKYMQKRFTRRENISFDIWFNQFYPNDNVVNKKVARIVLETIATEIKIKPTQIKPTDRFSEEFSLWPKIYKIFFLEDAIEYSIQIICSKFSVNKLPKCVNIHELIYYISKEVNKENFV